MVARLAALAFLARALMLAAPVGAAALLVSEFVIEVFDWNSTVDEVGVTVAVTPPSVF